MRTGRRMVVGVMTALCSLSMSNPAGAHITTHNDGQDADYGPEDLDIKKAAFTHTRRKVTVALTMHQQDWSFNETGDGFSRNLLATGNWVAGIFDINRDGCADYAVLADAVRAEGAVNATLRSRLFKYSQTGCGEATTDKGLAGVVQTPLGGYIAITIPKKKLGYTGTRKIQWYGLTQYSETEPCLETACYDQTGTNYFIHRT